VTTRLHVLLGAGGVGKTTLAAGYALALARTGARVGLLGIDPARRLQGALGIALGDVEVDVPVPGPVVREGGGVRAALLAPDQCLRRWAEEACPDPDARARLGKNPFFLALADRLAGATDVLAAVRVAEWIERHPDATDLIVDTAPGLDAIEFLRRPRVLTAFLEGRLVTWLRWLARADGTFPRGAAMRALGAVARIGGTRLLSDLAEFVSLVEGVFARMLARLEVVQQWLARPTTEIMLVTTVREDAAEGARAIAAELSTVGLAARRVVINRALSPEVVAELGTLDEPAPSPALSSGAASGAAVVRYARAYAAVQRHVTDGARALAPIVLVPHAPEAAEAKLESLAALGAFLVESSETDDGTERSEDQKIR
jgi:anion-transporting  ArsA/GET3 family ATPase